MNAPDTVDDNLVRALRDAGCVFAEDEARLLRGAARNDRDLATLLQQRVAGAPIEQLVGSVEFCGLNLHVGAGMFVPRQRTRMLAELASGRVTELPRRAVFLEVFGGVGPLASVVRAAAPDADVHVADIDGDALRYARLNVGHEASIHVGSVFEGLPSGLRGHFDVIAGVPPYVPTTQEHLLPREAAEFEPAIALFGGDDGLEHVRRVLADVDEWLAPGGILLLEMHRGQGGVAAPEARASGYRAHVHEGQDGQTAVLEVGMPGGPDGRQAGSSADSSGRAA